MIRPLPSGNPYLRPDVGRDTPQAPAPAPDAAAAKPESALSAEEARMIADQFPERPEMTLRLYGPGRTGNLQPRAVGGRIDLRG